MLFCIFKMDIFLKRITLSSLPSRRMQTLLLARFVLNVYRVSWLVLPQDRICQGDCLSLHEQPCPAGLPECHHRITGNQAWAVQSDVGSGLALPHTALSTSSFSFPMGGGSNIRHRLSIGSSLSNLLHCHFHSMAAVEAQSP